jgi:uncharacterized protein (TIGR00255 family)
MTGFGKAVVELPTKKITIEIKSLNSKQLDLGLKVAPQYRDLEAPIRALISQKLERGKVDFNLMVESTQTAGTPHLNVAAIEAYKKQIDALAQTMGAETPSYAELLPTLLRLPDAILVEAPVVDDSELEQVMEGVRQAVERLVDFRKQEGEMLYGVFSQKIANIAQLLEAVAPFEAERIENIRQRLLDQLTKLPVDYDKNRYEQELIYYIEKLDINEEKHRLDNHLKYFVETLDHGSNGQGKKLGFIAQEMGREINTLGSKANHAELQRIVVKMKDELEQIKEQVLNVA